MKKYFRIQKNGVPMPAMLTQVVSEESVAIGKQVSVSVQLLESAYEQLSPLEQICVI